VWGSECTDSLCQALPGFDATKSSTVSDAHYQRNLSVSYGDGSEAHGDYIRDKVAVGGISLDYDLGEFTCPPGLHLLTDRYRQDCRN
jgi:hypothetical protein